MPVSSVVRSTAAVFIAIGVAVVPATTGVSAAPSTVSLTDTAFARQAAGDEVGARRAIEKMPVTHAARVRLVISEVRRALELPLTERVPVALRGGTAIVILGYGLKDDGQMRPILVERLTKGLAVARMYPDSPVIVTGGNPKAGRTEAAAMGRWLVSNGIAQHRIVAEPRAVSTQSNALNTATLMRKNGFHSGAVLVTSADHARRSAADFLVAGVDVSAVVPSDSKLPSGRMSARELAAIYRDARGVANL